MYSFHITIHGQPPGLTRGESIEFDGRKVSPLATPREAMSHPMAVSFEQAADRLGDLPRLFFEPDGSFVWVSSAEDATRWQVDGNLTDLAGKLLFIDLKGTCPREDFDQLLFTFGWPDAPLMFQLVRQAVFLDEGEFRRFAGQE
jgi:hypothetical protein